MEKLSLEYIADWLKINRPEFLLDNENIYINARSKLKFFHFKCNDYFYMEWACFYRGIGCSICSGHQAGKYNNLAYLRPDLEKEWHPDNNIRSTDVTVSSGKRVYWICSVCNYGKNKEWCSPCNDRARYGCPACSGKIVTDRNRLSILYPKISKEWDHNKNKEIPENVSSGSHKEYWWLCSQNHSYKSSVASRTERNTGCKQCSNKRKESLVASELKSYLSSTYDAEIEYPILINPETNRVLPFDIYIPRGEDYKINGIYIEVHGEQHYKDRGKFHSRENSYAEMKHRDKTKKKFAKKNGLYIEIDLRKIKTTEQAIEHINSIIK